MAKEEAGDAREIRVFQIYESLSTRHQAQIRRAIVPRDIDPEALVVVAKQLGEPVDELNKLANLLYLVPHVIPTTEPSGLGEQLASLEYNSGRKLSIRRVAIVNKRRYPEDLKRLREILKKLRPKVNVWAFWRHFHADTWEASKKYGFLVDFLWNTM